MNEIYFNGTPALAYGLQLNRCTITPPEKKTKFLDIVGSDGSIDLMSGIGPPRYERRTVEADFVYCGDPRTIMERVINTLAEREMEIVLPGKPGYYLLGIIHVLGSSTNSSGGMAMEIDCMPWILRQELTVIEIPAASTAHEYTLYNQGLREVVPEIFSDGQVSVVAGGDAVELEAGHYVLPDLIIPGFDQRKIQLSGAECRIQYREAVLL